RLRVPRRRRLDAHVDLPARQADRVVDVLVGLAHLDLVCERDARLVGVAHRAQDLEVLARRPPRRGAAPYAHLALAPAGGVAHVESNEGAAEVSVEEAGPPEIRAAADREEVVEDRDALADPVAGEVGDGG